MFEKVLAANAGAVLEVVEWLGDTGASRPVADVGRSDAREADRAPLAGRRPARLHDWYGQARVS